MPTIFYMYYLDRSSSMGLVHSVSSRITHLWCCCCTRLYHFIHTKQLLQGHSLNQNYQYFRTKLKDFVEFWLLKLQIVSNSTILLPQQIAIVFVALAYTILLVEQRRCLAWIHIIIGRFFIQLLDYASSINFIS